MSRPVISIEGIGKAYRIGLEDPKHQTLRDALAGLVRAPFERFRRLGEAELDGRDTFWALRDASFEVGRGEVVGIIGRNGAGKSTLLKVLSRITEPTEGIARLRGRVASLLEVGTGFHPELTGRENIYLNGAILGMKRTEVKRKFDEIVDFSGVEKFLDTPVKRYSSGMYVRLAFAVAAHLEPEILIVDEVLAVGDAEFQKKCLGKMQEVATGQGRTVLFVSHNMGAIRTLCPRAVLLRQGRVVQDGPVDETVREYLSYLGSGSTNAFENNPERSGSGELRLSGARLLDQAEHPIKEVIAGSPVALELSYENRAGLSRVDLVATVHNHLGIAATCMDTRFTDATITGLGATGRFVCHIPKAPFPPGEYRVAVAVQADGRNLDLIPNALVFKVTTSSFFSTHRTPSINYSACLIDHQWQHRVGSGANGQERSPR